FLEKRNALLASLVVLNPDAPLAELQDHADVQACGWSNPALQLHRAFGDRVMSEYVTVAFLSHALSEALINAVLAIGLVARGSSDLFALLERADIKEKWLIGPKSISSAYEFPKAGALYETLHHLTKQRNAFVHYKIELEVKDAKVLKGSRLQRLPLAEHLRWMHRYFSLPYDLAAFVRLRLPGLPVLFLYNSGSLERYMAHAEA
ncbi:MAG: hypothetical protein JNM52_01235, partial [Betaproteobacteria bacterium]|nr:hypothetical protein [Betaproteobacteria bacterium]